MVHQNRPSMTYKALIDALNHPNTGPLLLIRFFIMLAYTIFWSVFSLFAHIKLNLSMQSTGFVMAAIGFYSVIVQGVGIGLLTKRFKDSTIIISSLWLMLLGLIGWSMTSNLLTMLLVILPLAGGGWTLNTIVTSALTKAVHPDEVGGILGISAASDSVSRLLAPVFGGFMIGSNSAWAPGVVSAVLMILPIWFAYRRIVHVKELVEPQVAEVDCA